MKRAFSAQAAIYVVLFVWMILWPMVVNLIPAVGEFRQNDFLLWTHPFVSIAKVMQLASSSEPVISSDASGFYTGTSQLLFYGFLIFFFIYLAVCVIGEKTDKFSRRFPSA